VSADFTILDAMDHAELWAGWFRDRASWGPWRAFLSVLFGLPEDQVDLIRRCTGRAEVPAGGFNEAWLICGRRAGKSFMLALIACYLAVFRDWRPYLAPGEVGTIKIVAVDRKQAKVIHRYCRALLTRVPAFHELIERETDDEIVLSNAVTIEIQSANFRSVRGFTLIAGLFDELAYLRSDENSANPDSEILNSARPAMATVPGAMLLCASSPYARRGELWNAYKQWYGDDQAPVLVWHAPTRTMNPTVPQRIIDKALEEDPARGAAEYLAEFRSDIDTFVNRDTVEAAVIPGRRELPWQHGVTYFAFVDPSGAAQDAMTLCIAHADTSSGVERRGLVDVIREVRPPFSPQEVVGQFSDLLKEYRVAKVSGDHWGGEWVVEAFRERGISYARSDKVKSAIYQEFLAPLNSGRIELLDHPRLISQLCALERRTGRGTGRDSIDHPPGAHDDVVNAVAGALVLAVGGAAPWDMAAMLAEIQANPGGWYRPRNLRTLDEAGVTVRWGPPRRHGVFIG
jgi:hypothetical protein